MAVALCSGFFTKHFFTKSVNSSDHNSGFRNVGGGFVGIIKIAYCFKGKKKKKSVRLSVSQQIKTICPFRLKTGRKKESSLQYHWDKESKFSIQHFLSLNCTPHETILHFTISLLRSEHAFLVMHIQRSCNGRKSNSNFIQDTESGNQLVESLSTVK